MMVATMFAALFLAHALGPIALLVALYDGVMALIWYLGIDDA